MPDREPLLVAAKGPVCLAQHCSVGLGFELMKANDLLNHEPRIASAFCVRRAVTNDKKC
ncbi:hypothetical protein E2C01_079571 [Portunus trituberculatus]|uniref:Uncharacterized protein n=1 Tax=Portunus trituberculatus TaxID=210409 RepID=A0A5B7IH93_PORTR|nr:hypothetical protein [Portunus trituberculatus]